MIYFFCLENKLHLTEEVIFPQMFDKSIDTKNQNFDEDVISLPSTNIAVYYAMLVEDCGIYHPAGMKGHCRRFF